MEGKKERRKESIRKEVRKEKRKEHRGTKEGDAEQQRRGTKGRGLFPAGQAELKQKDGVWQVQVQVLTSEGPDMG